MLLILTTSPLIILCATFSSGFWILIIFMGLAGYMSLNSKLKIVCFVTFSQEGQPEMARVSMIVL